MVNNDDASKKYDSYSYNVSKYCAYMWQRE